MIIAELALLVALACTPQVKPPALSSDHLVALVFSDTDTQFARLDDSQRLYEAIEAKRLAGTWNDEDRRLHAALVQALGVETRIPPLGTRERLDWEIRRGVRPPLQKPESMREEQR